MVSALVPGSSGLGSSPGGGHCVVFLGKTRNSRSSSQCLSPPRCINEYRRIVGGNLTNCGGVACDGLVGVEILHSRT